MFNEDSDAESVGTATSYAPSQTGDSALRPPSRPPTAADDLPFECTICYHIVNAPNERLWRQHVYEDLPPYVCVYEVCMPTFCYRRTFVTIRRTAKLLHASSLVDETGDHT